MIIRERNPINIQPILDYMHNNNLSKKEFANLCEISLSTLQRILQSQDSNIKISIIIKIANTIDCTLDKIAYKE